MACTCCYGKTGVKRPADRPRGFTLIELLIVVAIIAILAVLAVPRFQDALIKARAAKVQGDFKAIKMAMERYRLDNGTYCNDDALTDEDIKRDPPTAYNIAYVQLTTPVSYLATGHFYDHFAPIDNRSLDRGKMQHQYDLRTANWEQVLKEPNQDLEAPKPYDCFVLTSCGPDGQDDTASSGYYPRVWGFRKVRGVGKYMAASGRLGGRWCCGYDPTNGIKSDGDLYAFGGVHRVTGRAGEVLGHWCD